MDDTIHGEIIDLMADTIHREVLDLKDGMIDLRRDFHQFPELAFKEERTSLTIARHLTELGLQVKTAVAETGVVGILEGKGPGRTLLLRADMDALPIQEQNEVSYRSKNKGRMHACAHDGHMAILLTAATILSGHRDAFSGQIKFVFQPGEEGYAGAREMISEGVMEEPKVDGAFGLHLLSSIPVGRVAIGSGPIMASMDSFTLEIEGKGGHAAMPEEAVDAILISSHVITSLQTLISKEVAPLTPLVVHVGTIHGGDAFNVVADRVELEGTVRTLDASLRDSMPGRMERITKSVTAAFRGTYKLDYRTGYPPVVNDGMMAQLVREATVPVVGEGGIIQLPPVMASDDMAFFLQEVPGCFFFVGAGNAESGMNQPHHNPLFDFDEHAMVNGAEILIRTALDYLKET